MPAGDTTYLPIELVLNVVRCSLPVSPDVILSPNHPTTKLLLSFTLVCRETQRLATRYLRQYCVYLDTETRLSKYLLRIPEQPSFRNISKLALSPFINTIDDWPTSVWVRELLFYVNLTLKKLIINIPMQTCYPEDDHLGVRRVLREAFESLENLEEFSSIQDEFYLEDAVRGESVVWSKWPKLRRMALCDAAANMDFWWHVAKHPHLDSLVLLNPDWLMEVDPKREYLQHTTRELCVLIVRHRHLRVGWPDYHYDQEVDWESRDPRKCMKITATEPFLDHLPYGLIDRRPLHRFVQEAAESGELWSWHEHAREVLDPAELRLDC